MNRFNFIFFQKLRRYVFFVSPFFILLFFLPFFTAFAAESDYINSLIQKAREKNLHNEKYWHILLHYKKGPLGIRSLIDDPNFFIAPDGKSNPESELEADIRAFFQKGPGDKDHPLCRFIARYNWLKEQLAFDESKFPVSVCEDFNNVLSQVKPSGATIVFPTYYMNSPASMFGHTIINIDTSYKSRLLSQAINYSALTDESRGAFFAIKGLFGLYKGYYSILPYYQKIQQYSDISQRDIWEYPLNLNPSEVENLLRHIWELQNIYADYYFFDENCSYNLLFLIEAARPSVNLTSKFPFWALPIDTIKAMKDENLIENVDYRPSRAAKIQHKMSLLSYGSQKTALDMISGKIQTDDLENIEKNEKIKIMDIAVEYLQYKYAVKKMEKEKYQKIILNLLKARSRLGQAPDGIYDIEAPPRPDEIHGSRRFSIGTGFKNGRFFQEIAYRPVFIDVLDTDYMYKEGTQIEFFNTRARYYPSDNTLSLEDIRAIDIVSIAPRNIFFKPYSWKVNTGFSRVSLKEDHDALIYDINTGGGFAFYHENAGICYLFTETGLNIGGGLDKSHALGAGFSAGIIKQAGRYLKFHASAKYMYYPIGDEHDETSLSFSQRFKLSRSHALDFKVLWEKNFDDDNAEVFMGWHVFF